MNEEEVREFEKATQAYGFGFQQNVMQYLKLLEQKGYTIADAERYIPAKRKLIDKEAEAFAEIQKLMERKCPECSGLMLLLPVNITPETQTGDPDDKSVWLCQNDKCMDTIYNKETIEEIIKKE